MLFDKEKVKKKMSEFIIDSYWLKTPMQFKDIKNKFCAPPISLSSGTVVNYLNELVDERKIIKWREESNTFYGPMKMSFTLKILFSVILISMFLLVISSTLTVYYNDSIITKVISDIRFIFCIVGFDMGAGFVCFLWFLSTKNINTKSNER